MSELTSILIPSYRRPDDLQRCFTALASQTRKPGQVITVARTGDSKTIALCQTWQTHLPLTIVEVTTPGQVHALNAGLAHCTGEIVAITDDDAAPHADWLARIEARFAANPKLGGVGGRDWVHHHGRIETGPAHPAGKVQFFGRITGNHHLGTGPARDVDILKGANCAFRMQAIRPIGFNTTLRGTGAQVHNDMVACLAIKRAGWRIIYDPAIAVDHFPAPRFDSDARNQFNPQATADRAYNLRVALSMISPPPLRYAAWIWHYLVGTRDEPGIFNLARALSRRDPNAWKRFRAAHNPDTKKPHGK